MAVDDGPGAINLHKPRDPDDSYSGVLLACHKHVEFNAEEEVYYTELQDVHAKIASGEYAPQNEHERLALYFAIVYPARSRGAWARVDTSRLVAWYQSLELYYKLPPEIRPRTPFTVRRKHEPFYRIPEGVVLDQDVARKAVVAEYIEVTRFGPGYWSLRDPRMFNGTYYYPCKGSGLYLPTGHSLVAYNKIHALKLLGVPNEDILRVSGRDFQAFLRADSRRLWHRRDRDSVATCVVTKRGEDDTCPAYMGKPTRAIRYHPQALDTMVREMAAGKSLREAGRPGSDGRPVVRRVYYGLGDTGDPFLAQIARDRGYDTLQFLREAQMATKGDAVVGNEFVHLMEPLYSQLRLQRLDPLRDVPPQPVHENGAGDEWRGVRYVLDSDETETVTTELVTSMPYRAWPSERHTIDTPPLGETASPSRLDLVVPLRNEGPLGPA